MGRHPKTITQHKLQGTYRADEHGHRGDEILAPGNLLGVDWGDDHFAQWIWDLLLPMAELTGAGEIDTAALCGCCQWYSRFRECMSKLETMEPGAGLYSSVQKAATSNWKNFLDISRDYGLTPQDRIKLAKPLPVDAEVDPLEALTAAMASAN